MIKTKQKKLANLNPLSLVFGVKKRKIKTSKFPIKNAQEKQIYKYSIILSYLKPMKKNF